MPTGPNLTAINGGDALSATPVADNFSELQSFVAAIPPDQLTAYKADLTHCATYDSLASAATRYFGYQKVEGGGFAIEPVQISLAGVCSAQIAATQTLTLSAEKASAATAAATWTSLGSVQLTQALTAAAYQMTFDAATFFYGNAASLTAQTIEDGYWIRFKLVDSGTTVTTTRIQATLHSKLRLRG